MSMSEKEGIGAEDSRRTERRLGLYNVIDTRGMMEGQYRESKLARFDV